ncbi:MAG: hypothetical protein ACLT4C_04870 [Butyricicoccus sp.]
MHPDELYYEVQGHYQTLVRAMDYLNPEGARAPGALHYTGLIESWSTCTLVLLSQWMQRTAATRKTKNLVYPIG